MAKVRSDAARDVTRNCDKLFDEGGPEYLWFYHPKTGHLDYKPNDPLLQGDAQSREQRLRRKEMAERRGYKFMNPTGDDAANRQQAAAELLEIIDRQQAKTRGDADPDLNTVRPQARREK